MTQTPENFMLTTLARGATAELRQIVENCEDRETARPIYTELKRLWHLMERKHGFGQHPRPHLTIEKQEANV